MADNSQLPGAAAVEVEAQSKVNLRLRILAQESNGYHQIETLFLRLNLADTVRVRRTGRERSLDVTGLADPDSIGPLEKNLAWRAAQAYLTASGQRHGFAIEIEKRIPIGGGLGGGSADAAAVLRAMEAMAVEPLGPRGLLTIAAQIGADVTFLASDAVFALAWGRGERLLALEPPQARAVLLVVPSFSVSTVDAYRWVDHERDYETEHPEPALIDGGALGDWDDICAVAMNEFESAVGSRHPEIAAVLDSLRSSEHAELALMSGSGSTLFAVAKEGMMVTDIEVPHAESLLARTIATHTATRVEPVTAIE
jgi:4-diphosphocytidyl-2-C-methyl-D-erythritol kinase